MAVKIQCQIGR